jgi:RNA polymerase sigma-70 factor (ECF subfamily)
MMHGHQAYRHPCVVSPNGDEMASGSQERQDNSVSTSSGAPIAFQRDLIALIPELRALSRLLCGNQTTAEDMAQEALAKAWRARTRFEPGSNLKAWLFTILRNEFYSHARRAWRETRWDEDLGKNVPAPAHQQERSMELSDTARALGKLPKRQREAVILVAAGGFTYDDAARLCGTHAQNMKSRVSRGRAGLLRLVEGNEPLPPRSTVRISEPMEDILAQLVSLAASGAAGAVQS